MENQEQKSVPETPTTPEQPIKKAKPKWLVAAIVVAGIIVLGLVGWAVYSLLEPPIPPHPPTECIDKCGDGECQDLPCGGLDCPCFESADNCPEDCKDETADWKTYRNEEYGFEIKYPEEFGEILINFSETQITGEFTDNPDIILGGITKDFTVGRSSYYLDFSGYGKEGDKYFWESVGDHFYPMVPKKIINEEILLVDCMSFEDKCKQTGPSISLPQGKIAGLINLPKGDFGLIIVADSTKVDESFFTQILSTFKFIETYTIQWEKEPVELDYTELDWPKEWTKELEDGSICEISVLDETPNPVMIPYRVGKFISGKYAGGEIITLFTAEATMGSQWAFLDRFVKLNNNYINLANNSSSFVFTPDCMGEFLKEFWNYKTDKETLINELIPPEILNGAEPNQKIYYKEDSDRNDFVFCKDPWNDEYVCKNEIAFKDISSGITVYFGTGAKGEDFSIRMPDGFEKTYTFKYEEVEEINSKIALNTGEAIQEEYTAYWISCATPILNLTNLQKTDLVEIGKNASGSFIYIDKENRQTKLLYDEIMTRADNYRPFTKTYDGFEKELPLFFWIDPFGRTIKFIRNDYYRKFLAPDGCS